MPAAPPSVDTTSGTQQHAEPARAPAAQLPGTSRGQQRHTWAALAALLQPVWRVQRVRRERSVRRVRGEGYRDPLFERPDVVEDDYYRFRHRPS